MGILAHALLINKLTMPFKPNVMWSNELSHDVISLRKFAHNSDIISNINGCTGMVIKTADGDRLKNYAR